MARVLITRLSSFGDVALLVPVVFSVAARYPQDRFIVLTRKSFAPLFENLGFNISAITFDPNKQHKGFLGLMKLLSRLSRSGFSHVADEHDVLRTKMIRGYMAILGKKVAHINKGRDEKKMMVETKNTKVPLANSVDRYMQVFEKLGFPAEMVFDNYFEFHERSLYPLRTLVTEKNGKWIGIAPFAKHKEKIYPLEKMEKVIAQLSQDSDNTVFLFGSGTEERAVLDSWAKRYPHVISVSGKLNLSNELLLMSFLDIMVTMDSANMHLASLVKVPVVSIWGATHPSFGFYGFGQDLDNALSVDIECRPCSVFGDTPCARGDYACLTRINELTIIEKIYKVLDNKAQNKEITD